MNKRQAGLMIYLADFLEKLPRKKFDLGEWSRGWDEENECGTTGCAIGWAATLPRFVRRGLKLRVAPNFSFSGEEKRCSVIYQPKNAARAAPMYPLDAAQVIFGIGYEDAFRLFMPSGYASEERTRPATVAARLRKLAARQPRREKEIVLAFSEGE